MQLWFSSHESEITKLRIARGTERFDSLPKDDLIRQILENQYDVCKIKMNSNNKDVFDQLDLLGFHYHIISVIYRNVKEIRKEDMSYKLPDGIEFEVYDGSQFEIYTKLVRSSIGNPTGVSYSIWPLNKMIPRELDLEMSVGYALEFEHGKSDPAKQAWLMKDNGNYVGYFMGILSEDHYEGTLYGVSNEHRNKGYGKVMYAFMQRNCAEMGIKYFYTDVQIQNYPSQISTIRGGLNPKSIYFHVCVTPFASYSSSDQKEVLLSLSDQSTVSEIIRKEQLKAMPEKMRLFNERYSYSLRMSVRPVSAYTRLVYRDDLGEFWSTKLIGADRRIIGIVSSTYKAD